MKRFIIQYNDDRIEDFHYEFVMESTSKAVKAFRTLYGQAKGYTLYEQVACSDPARSYTEADDANSESDVL